jgi:hypothetical protein
VAIRPHPIRTANPGTWGVKGAEEVRPQDRYHDEASLTRYLVNLGCSSFRKEEWRGIGEGQMAVRWQAREIFCTDIRLAVVRGKGRRRGRKDVGTLFAGAGHRANSR